MTSSTFSTKTPSGETCPRSAVSWTDPFIILAVIIVGFWGLRDVITSSIDLTLALTGLVCAVMIPIEINRAPWRGTARPKRPLRAVLRSSAIKWTGCMAGVGLVIAGWYLVPEYQRNSYATFLSVVETYWPFYAVAAAGFIFAAEWRLGPCEDGAGALANIVLGKWKDVNWGMVRDELAALFVKGFFLPLNLSGAFPLIARYRSVSDKLWDLPWPQMVQNLDRLIFACLLIAIIPGYVFNSRLLGTEVRKTEQSWFAWGVTMFCYPPINRGSGSGWFTYHPSGEVWTDLFGVAGMASQIVGVLLLIFYVMHYWGESICCLRSSHLTNRGIITNGPFRLTKHPVYVAKFGAWLLVYFPFAATDSFMGNVRASLAFSAFAAVYFARGWAEERLLSNDKTYVAYALWMDKHSVFSWVGRVWPLLSYQWRLEHWRKAGLIDKEPA